MSHTHARVLVHCIFSTEERANLIPDPVELCRYLTGVARAKKITLVAAGGTANHIHLLIAVPPAIPLAKAIRNHADVADRSKLRTGHRNARRPIQRTQRAVSNRRGALYPARYEAVVLE